MAKDKIRRLLFVATAINLHAPTRRNLRMKLARSLPAAEGWSCVQTIDEAVNYVSQPDVYVFIQ
jgi:hypothetical protein